VRVATLKDIKITNVSKLTEKKEALFNVGVNVN
jgi:hypothetical protein